LPGGELNQVDRRRGLSTLPPGRARNRFIASFKQTPAAIRFPGSLFLILVRHTRTLNSQHLVVNNMLNDGPDRNDVGWDRKGSELSIS
jgi:hypothetical protein